MIEHCEIVGVGANDVLLIPTLLVTLRIGVLDHRATPIVGPNEILYFRKFFLQNIAQLTCRSGLAHVYTCSPQMTTETIDLFMLRVILVVIEIVLQDEQKNHANG